MTKATDQKGQAIERVGIGTDIHRLESKGPLRLGGIDIDFNAHLHGHSDADVVLHAVADAILGAACLPDIGELFPDTDPAYAGCDSRELLRGVVAKLKPLGWVVRSMDVVIHAERPKLSPHKAVIRECLAGLVALSVDRISVKAKTNEGLDAVGRGEAIACTCVVGLGRADDCR